MLQLHNSDHTKIVIRTILLKYDMQGKPEDYVIFQHLSDDKGNYFKAPMHYVNSCSHVSGRMFEGDVCEPC